MEELQNIQDYIHVIRGHRVMLDRDIATFYGVETKRLNETKDEWEDIRLRSQIATLKPRKPIGFIQPEENDEEDKEEKK